MKSLYAVCPPPAQAAVHAAAAAVAATTAAKFILLGIYLSLFNIYLRQQQRQQNRKLRASSVTGGYVSPSYIFISSCLSLLLSLFACKCLSLCCLLFISLCLSNYLPSRLPLSACLVSPHLVIVLPLPVSASLPIACLSTHYIYAYMHIYIYIYIYKEPQEPTQIQVGAAQEKEAVSLYFADRSRCTRSLHKTSTLLQQKQQQVYPLS